MTHDEQADNVVTMRSVGAHGRAIPQHQLARRMIRPLREWLNFLRSDSAELRRMLAETYGPDRDLQETRRRLIIRTVELFAQCYGEQRRVVITRAPGRINLMGRHVDHRGGHVNMMTIHREIVVVASARDDSVVALSNLDAENFEDDRFDVRAELPHLREYGSWEDYIHSDRVQKFHTTSRGHWTNYVRAAMYRLAFHFDGKELRGMDVAVGGDIPIGAGLSSSSALLVATSFAAIVLNDLEVHPATFVDLCGRGEWFVGTRGGAGDHAAMTFPDRGKVTPISFFPFRVGEPVDFPDGYRLLIGNSKVQAKKTKGAQDTFNHRVACYELAMALFKKFFPRETEDVEHLRDIPEKLNGVDLPTFYTMVKALPLEADRGLLRQLLQDRSEWLEQVVFAKHGDSQTYRLRDVFMFGIAECERSRIFRDLLAAGDLETVGRMMCISHDGDRVMSFVGGRPRAWEYTYDDARLDDLARRAASADPRTRELAQLKWQPGAYRCSCWEIDEMVDCALEVPGVSGAQLSGAGMGGCMMVLVREDAAEQVQEDLARRYYARRDSEPEIEICRPIAGVCALVI